MKNIGLTLILNVAGAVVFSTLVMLATKLTHFSFEKSLLFMTFGISCTVWVRVVLLDD